MVMKPGVCICLLGKGCPLDKERKNVFRREDVISNIFEGFFFSISSKPFIQIKFNHKPF